MKRFLYLAAVLFSTQSHASNAINAAQCTLHGSNLWIPSKGAYDEIIVTSFAPKSSVAIALVEKVKNGSYLTYAHINIGLTERPEKTSLEIDVSSSAGTAHVEMEKGEGLKSKISFPPRIGEEMLVVNITCRPIAMDYLFVPTYSYDSNPLIGLSYLNTSVNHLLKNQMSFYSQPSSSLGEFLAQNYCLVGSAESALTELRSAETFWRRDIQNPNVFLKPGKLHLTWDGSIHWDQPRQELLCVKGHEEKRVNEENGVEEIVTICDQTEKRALPPLELSIRTCR